MVPCASLRATRPTEAAVRRAPLCGVRVVPFQISYKKNLTHLNSPKKDNRPDSVSRLAQAAPLPLLGVGPIHTQALTTLVRPYSTSRPRFNAWKEALDRRASELRSLRSATSQPPLGASSAAAPASDGGTKGARTACEKGPHVYQHPTTIIKAVVPSIARSRRAVVLCD